jgi:hypothetical protein
MLVLEDQDLVVEQILAAALIKLQERAKELADQVMEMDQVKVQDKV